METWKYYVKRKLNKNCYSIDKFESAEFAMLYFQAFATKKANSKTVELYAYENGKLILLNIWWRSVHNPYPDECYDRLQESVVLTVPLT